MSRFIDLFKRARGDASVRRVEAQVDHLTKKIDRMAELVSEMAGEDSARDLHAGRSTSRAEASRRAPISLKTDSGSWKERAQEGELEFHKKPNVRSGDAWEADTDRKWTTFGFDRNAWKDRLIVDVGAGSRLRTKWFSGARIAAIEPLGDRYIREVEWQDLSDADELYSTPAEDLIPELEGRADLVVSINALDHGYDFEGATRSIRSYLREDGMAFLSFDQHEEPDEMHPLVLNAEITRAVFERNGFSVERFEEAGRYHGGPGLLALNYWLRPVKQ